MHSGYLTKIDKENSYPAIVLVEPSKPQNLGSIARVMMNLNFDRLVLVNPKLNLSDSEISIVSRRAQWIIDQADLLYSFKEVRSKYKHLIATTSRSGGDYNLIRVALPPEKFVDIELQWGESAVVFGGEQNGLTNDEIAFCDSIVTIPTNPEYPSMNLSHSVSIILYFIARNIMENIPKGSSQIKHRGATFQERDQMLIYFEQLLTRTNYHKEKQHIALQAMSNIISRCYVTGREISTLMGVFKWIKLKLDE
ncbi:MAG: RNA methyltransferase [Candidatus Hodarchaeales archaeon]